MTNYFTSGSSSKKFYEFFVVLLVKNHTFRKIKQTPTSLSSLRSKIVILIFQLQSSEWQWRLNAEWTMNALWTIGERTVSERWTLCERWTRANGERWTQNCERWTHDERTLNARWTDGERTVNERKNGKVESFRDCITDVLKMFVNTFSRMFHDTLLETFD